MTRPLTHPLTGRPLNHRPLKRALSYSFITPAWMPANTVAAGYPAAAILCPPWLTASVSSGSDILIRPLNGYEGYLRQGTAASVGATATLAVTQTVSLAPAGVAANRFGLHLWIRYGNNAGGPSTFSGATLTLAFNNTGATSGFTISQASSAATATLTVHGDTTYAMDGSGGLPGSAAPIDLRDYRAQQIGVEYEPRDQEVILVRTTPDERRNVIYRRTIPNIVTTTAIQPRVIVTSEAGTAMQLQTRRVDFEVWS